MADGAATVAVDPASLSVRDELLMHHEFARDAALTMSCMRFQLERLIGGGWQDDASDVDPVSLTLDLCREGANISSRWPRAISYLASLALSAGARASNPQSTSGGSIVERVQSAACGLEHYAAAINKSESEAERLLVMHTAELRDHPETARVRGLMEPETLTFDGAAIDAEVVAALAWSGENLEPYHSTKPETPRATGDQAAGRGSRSCVVAYLKAIHAKQVEQGELSPKKAVDIAAETKASTATVSRTLKDVFGDLGHGGYVASCDRGDVISRLAAYEQDGQAFGTADPASLNA